MYCRHLALANFRNYTRLDFELPPHISLFWGDNGQGKSNLLEAIYLLATSRSYRTASERELINWRVEADPAFARVAGDVARHPSTTRLEVLLVATKDGSVGAGTTPDGGAPPGETAVAGVRRRVRVNGHHRPTAELLGHLNVVLFAPEDVELIAGPAEVRRRYLWVTLCQVDHRYLRTLRRYQRVLLQRNALLRALRERAAQPDQLAYWDGELVELGAEIMVAHLRALALLNQLLAGIHPRLTGEPAALQAVYRPTVNLAQDVLRLGERAAGDGEAAVLALVRERYAAQLEASRPRERRLAMTLAGPHRDDVGFLMGGMDLRSYGSRGQQRAAALAVKLAEVALMQRYTGERPVLLLDDVMSELDQRRRSFLQTVVLEQEQVLITATDQTPFSAQLLGAARVFRVEGGVVEPAAT